MSKVLAYTTPAIGHLYPIVPILQELKERGHEVALHTLSTQVEPMREQGFDAHPIAQAVEQIELNDHKGRSPLVKGRLALAAFVARAKHDGPDLQQAITTHRPDVLLIDCLAWGAAAVAEASGLPWAQFVPFPLATPSRETPPFGLGLKPAAGPLGRLRDRAWAGPTALANDLGNLGRLNAIRSHLGAAPLEHVTDIYTRAPLVLHLTAPPLEYSPSDLPPQVLRVGPCSWDRPSEPPAWLADLERPLVLVSTSSERQHDEVLVRTALEALAGLDYEVLATLPAGADLGVQVPANARIERFVSHGAVIPRAACVVSHGGAGVTQKALAAGVPVCVVPFGRDQHEVARRVLVAGVGTRLGARRLSPERLRAKVQEAIEKTPAAKALGEAFAAAPGPAGAAEAIERTACTHN